MAGERWAGPTQPVGIRSGILLVEVERGSDAPVLRGERTCEREGQSGLAACRGRDPRIGVAARHRETWADGHELRTAVAVRGDVAGFRQWMLAVEWTFILPLLAGIGVAIGASAE